MMNWNYRVFKEPNGDYIIREVFYAEDGTINRYQRKKHEVRF
jgi:hypothetical protein